MTSPDPDIDSVAARFHEIVSGILGTPGLDVDPWLHRYCGQSATPAGAPRYVRHQVDLLELGRTNAKDAVIVDAGCGFGFAMIVHALLGARHVQGVELYPEMVRSFETYEPLLPRDVASRIDIVQGSVAEMPYEDRSVDIVLSIEAISHYLDVPAFIAETRRILRPDGVLIIADGNNAMNPLMRRRSHDLWEAFEGGPAGQEIHGHLVGVPYVERRRQTLERRFPGINESTRDEIAVRTSGFTDEQLSAAAREHLDTGALPDCPYRRGQLAIAPDGQAMERLFSPHALAQTLERSGFRANAYGYWGGASGGAAVRALNRMLASLSCVSVVFAPSFRVIARKLPN